MESFGELFKGVGELFAGLSEVAGEREGAEIAAEALAGDGEDGPAAGTVDRYLAGGPRPLNLNDI
jgi:hypothetical protein